LARLNARHFAREYRGLMAGQGDRYISIGRQNHKGGLHAHDDADFHHILRKIIRVRNAEKRL
jgi:hypothetical protein